MIRFGLLLLAACHAQQHEATTTPEPVSVAPAAPESEAEPSSAATPRLFAQSVATDWVEQMTAEVLDVLSGGEPRQLPIAPPHEPSASPWVELDQGVELPSRRDVVLWYAQSTVSLTNGAVAQVAVVLTRSSVRLAQLQPVSGSSLIMPREGLGYFEPMQLLAEHFIEEFREGQGGDTLITLAEMQALVGDTRLTQRTMDRLPRPDVIEATELALADGNVRLASIQPEEIGFLIRAADNTLYALELNVGPQGDSFVFEGPPLILVHQLD